MSENSGNDQPLPEATPHVRERLTRRFAWGWWFFTGAALFYLLSEHRAHFFGVLPYLLLLACPLMHFFMHRGHGHGGQGKDKGEQS